MTKEQVDELTRVAVIRSMTAGGDVLTEFAHRFPNDEPLIEEIRARQREALTMLIAIPDVRASSK